jgi:hypothetical protein
VPALATIENQWKSAFQADRHCEGARPTCSVRTQSESARWLNRA